MASPTPAASLPLPPSAARCACHFQRVATRASEEKKLPASDLADSSETVDALAQSESTEKTRSSELANPSDAEICPTTTIDGSVTKRLTDLALKLQLPSKKKGELPSACLITYEVDKKELYGETHRVECARCRALMVLLLNDACSFDTELSFIVGKHGKLKENLVFTLTASGASSEKIRVKLASGPGDVASHSTSAPNAEALSFRELMLYHAANSLARKGSLGEPLPIRQFGPNGFAQTAQAELVECYVRLGQGQEILQLIREATELLDTRIEVFSAGAKHEMYFGGADSQSSSSAEPTWRAHYDASLELNRIRVHLVEWCLRTLGTIASQNVAADCVLRLAVEIRKSVGSLLVWMDKHSACLPAYSEHGMKLPDFRALPASQYYDEETRLLRHPFQALSEVVVQVQEGSIPVSDLTASFEQRWQSLAARNESLFHQMRRDVKSSPLPGPDEPSPMYRRLAVLLKDAPPILGCWYSVAGLELRANNEKVAVGSKATKGAGQANFWVTSDSVQNWYPSRGPVSVAALNGVVRETALIDLSSTPASEDSIFMLIARDFAQLDALGALGWLTALEDVDLADASAAHVPSRRSAEPMLEHAFLPLLATRGADALKLGSLGQEILGGADAHAQEMADALLKEELHKQKREERAAAKKKKKLASKAQLEEPKEEEAPPLAPPPPIAEPSPPKIEEPVSVAPEMPALLDPLDESAFEAPAEFSVVVNKKSMRAPKAHIETVVLKLHADEVPRCLGPRRTTLNQIESESNSQIEIDRQTMSDGRVNMRIKGEASCVAAAVALVESVRNGSYFRNHESSNRVGRVAGHLGGAGLSNSKGDNSCFLNVVMQGLFHLESFAGPVKKLGSAKTHVCRPSSDPTLPTPPCITCAVINVFKGLESGGEESVSSVEIREAVAAAFEGHFDLGLQADAGEAFNMVLEAIHAELAKSPAKLTDCSCIVHECFVSRSESGVSCPKCISPSSNELVPVPGMEKIERIMYFVQAAIFPIYPDRPLGELIQITETNVARSCPKCDTPGLEVLTSTSRFPSVVAVGISWMSAEPDLEEEIKPVLEGLNHSRTLEFSQINPNIPLGSNRRIALRGIFCYARGHYVAFFRKKASQAWYMFNDENVFKTGNDFSFVVKQCETMTLCPSVVLYD